MVMNRSHIRKRFLLKAKGYVKIAIHINMARLIDCTHIVHVVIIVGNWIMSFLCSVERKYYC
ncbi:hypothetical protein A9G49_09380 [Aeromonas sp. ANP5]|nr:hypothetical protein A9G04_09645 [Aeromonas sp. ANNP30]OEC65337.1 hypothetical protein A9G49_09380 [Aeromonas sp. ANP5]